MRCTDYFREQVLRKRPYLKWGWIEEVLADPESKEVQSDGRIKFWAYIEELDKYLRVVTLDDGITVHNAFPDRDYEPKTK